MESSIGSQVFIIVFSQCDVISQTPTLLELKSNFVGRANQRELGIIITLSANCAG